MSVVPSYYRLYPLTSDEIFTNDQISTDEPFFDLISITTTVGTIDIVPTSTAIRYVDSEESWDKYCTEQKSKLNNNGRIPI